MLAKAAPFASLKRIKKRYVALAVFCAFIAYDLSPLNENAAARSSAMLAAYLMVLVAAPSVVWRLTDRETSRRWIAALHGGQVAMVSAGALLSVRLLFYLYPRVDDLWAVGWEALLVGLGAVAVLLPWRWFDSRK